MIRQSGGAVKGGAVFPVLWGNKKEGAERPAPSLFWKGNLFAEVAVEQALESLAVAGLVMKLILKPSRYSIHCRNLASILYILRVSPIFFPPISHIKNICGKKSYQEDTCCEKTPIFFLYFLLVPSSAQCHHTDQESLK